MIRVWLSDDEAEQVIAACAERIGRVRHLVGDTDRTVQTSLLDDVVRRIRLAQIAGDILDDGSDASTMAP